MKSQLDALMQERGLAALFITGGEGYSEIRDYMCNGAHITGGYIIKTIGQDPLLIVSGMETEEAKKSGYAIKTTAEVGFYDLLAAYTNRDIIMIRMWEKCLQAAGVMEGKIGVYGRGNIHNYYEWMLLANKELPHYEFVGETKDNIFDLAFLTKDAAEVERIKSVGARTNEVVDLTWNLIASHSVNGDETLVKADGSPLTIGDIKTFVRVELLKRGLEDTDMIFAQGRDGGFPHSRGEEAMPLKLGQAIVFDIFPRELGGGYFHDMTRTWCIGYAPPEVQAAYDEVMQAFDLSLEMFGVGKPTYLAQEAVQDFFEKNGHPTLRTDPKSQVGYVHSLGHGLGLQIHEAPAVNHVLRDDIWQVGNVVTIEPGLYYPDKGYGIRIEDTFLVTEQGELISLTPFKKDLVIPMKLG